MPWWTSVSVGIFLLTVIVVGAATVRTIGTLRAARTAERTIPSAFGSLLEAADGLERRLAALEERRARVEERTETLRRSFAKLALLRRALEDSLDPVTRLRKAVPRK